MCFPSDLGDEEETEGADTGRVRRSDGLAMLDDNDGVDAGETTLPLECPPGCALSRSAPPALDPSFVKRDIMPAPRVRIDEGLHHATGTGPDASELGIYIIVCFHDMPWHAGAPPAAKPSPASSTAYHRTLHGPRRHTMEP